MYQLLTAICGTILQAQKDNASLAILVVHEFKSKNTSLEKQTRNHIELEKLLSFMSAGRLKRIKPAILCGTFFVGGIEVMVGKVVKKL